MAVTRAPRKPQPKRDKLFLRTIDRKSTNILRNMLRRAAKIHVWTIERHQSGYLKEESDIEEYINRFYQRDPYEWFPRDLMHNVMMRSRMHYLANPDSKADFRNGWVLPFSYKDYRTRQQGFEFNLLDEVPHLDLTWLAADNSHESLLEFESSNQKWIILSYSKARSAFWVMGERKRHLGLREDVTGGMFYGYIDITNDEYKLLKLTAGVVSHVRTPIINMMSDYFDARGVYPTWDYTVRELGMIKNQLDPSHFDAYRKGISASYYHTALQALHKFNTEGQAKPWPYTLDRLSIFNKPSTKTERGFIHLPKIGKREFIPARGNKISSIVETVKLPHVLCLYLNRTDYARENNKIRFGIYATDPERFNRGASE